MNNIIRNTVAIVGGLIFGSAINMGLISVGSALIPPPPGVDVSTMASLAAAMPSFGPKHFLFPFLAHALGTFAGAAFAVKIAATHKPIMAGVIGVAFLAGGIAMVFSLPSPLWFNALDLVAAYLPMAYFGHRAFAK